MSRHKVAEVVASALSYSYFDRSSLLSPYSAHSSGFTPCRTAQESFMSHLHDHTRDNLTYERAEDS